MYPSGNGAGNTYVADAANALSDYFLVSSVSALREAAIHLLRHRYDAFILNWPENVFAKQGVVRLAWRTLILSTILTVPKLKRTCLIWTFHNSRPHRRERPFSARTVMQMCARRADLVLTHAERGRQILADVFGRTHAVYVVDHGSYRRHFPDRNTKVARVEAPRQDGFVRFGIFGAVRPYKQVHKLLTQYLNAGLEPSRLTIWGRIRDPRVQFFLDTDPRTKGIHVRDAFIPESEIPDFFANVDYCLFAHETESAIVSGAAFLCLSFGVPIIVPRTSGLADLSNYDFVTTYATYSELRSLLAGLKNLHRSDTTSVKASIDEYWRMHDWSHYASQVNTIVSNFRSLR